MGTLNANPLIVGRGHSAQLSAASTYASWLEQLRADYALRLTNAGRFAHRSGQLSAPNTLALGGLVLQAPVLVPQVTPALKHAALRDGGAAVDAAAVATLRAVVVAGHTAGLA